LHPIQLLPNLAASFLDGDCLLDGFFVAGMHRRQFFHLQDMHAEVADFAEAQSGELRDCFPDPRENSLEQMMRVASADCQKEIA